LHSKANPLKRIVTKAGVALVLLMTSASTGPVAAAARPVASMSDINDAGRVMAQLNDVRAIFFVLIIVIFLLFCLVIWVFRALVGNLSLGVKDLAKSIDNMTKASVDRTTADLVNHARLESVMTRSEQHLATLAARTDGGNAR
jgi:hypothetical protein